MLPATPPAICVSTHAEAVVVSVHAPLDDAATEVLIATLDAAVSCVGAVDRLIIDLRQAERCDREVLARVARFLDAGAALRTDMLCWRPSAERHDRVASDGSA